MICKNHEILEPVWLHFFHHSISITHHSIFHTRLASSLNFHHSIFFTLFVGPYMSVAVTFFFFFKLRWVWVLKKKKKVKRWPKVGLWVPPCVFIYENAIELWVIETENSLWLFSVSITHNSKIRELSDGNNVIVWPNNLFIMGPTIFELWVMETENWVIKFGWPNSLLFSKPICNFLTKDAYARVAYAT